jgi:DNA-binding CsgD family transcriptional regulator
VWVRCEEFEQAMELGLVAILLGDRDLGTCSQVEAGRRLLARLSELQSADRVGIVVVDDAQWMDRSSAQALRFALRRTRVDRILFLLARRPGARGATDRWTADPSATTLITPGPLGPEAVGELAQRLRGWRLSPRQADALARRTEGVPLLVGAFLRGAPSPTALVEGAEVPATVAEAASRLLAGVDEGARRLVEASAVVAEPIELLILGRIAQVSEAGRAATEGAAAGLLRLGGGELVDSAHALLRDAVYAAISVDDRRRLHARAAEETSGDRRLAHRAAATAQPDPELVEALLAAADLARESLRFGRAATLRLRARSVCGDVDRRDALLLEAVLGFVEAEELDRAETWAVRARQAPPSALRSLALGLLAREQGRVGEATTLLWDARRRARTDGDLVMQDRADLAAAVLHVRLNDSGPALDILRGSPAADDPELTTDLLTTRGIAQWQAGTAEQALVLLQAAPTTPEAAPWHADLVAVRGMVQLYAGNLAAALADLDTAVAQTHLWRPSTNQTRTFVLRSSTRMFLGDWDGAAVDAAAARALAEASPESWSLALTSAVSAEVPTQRGQWDVAAGHLERARTALTTLPTEPVDDAVAYHEMTLALARDDPEEVQRVLWTRRSEEYLVRLAALRSYRWILPGWIAACLRLGQLAAAELELARYVTLLRRWPGGPAPGRLGWLRGRLAEARGDPLTARSSYAEDLADPRTATVPFVHAQLLYASGRLERAVGNRRVAVDRLAAARGLFLELGAVPDVERCREALGDAGLRSSVADPLSLTAREEDVAALVGRGHTNKEVAAELFLTDKTVEHHLHHVYRKLGITTRQELRRLRSRAVGVQRRPPGSPTG